MKTLYRIWADFIGLFFPRLCLACNNPLPHTEQFVCLDCQVTLPETDFQYNNDNLFVQKFDGRIGIEGGYALYYFTKKSKTQHLIHAIKYQDKREAAIATGQILGKKILEGNMNYRFEWIIPVPMHPKKEIERGYNQAQLFAEGLSDSLQTPVNSRIIAKTKATESQTRKSKLERLRNTEDIFKCNASTKDLKGKHLLIVDDVMTTGATLEACALAIFEVEKDVKISFATIAFAKY